MEGATNAPGSGSVGSAHQLNKPGASVSEWTYGAMAAFFMAIALGSYIPLGLTTWTTVTSTVISGVVSAWALCGGTFRLAHSIRHLSVAKIFLVVGVASRLQAAEAFGDQNHMDWLMLTAVVDSSSRANSPQMTMAVFVGAALVVGLAAFFFKGCWKQKKESQTGKERFDKEEKRHDNGLYLRLLTMGGRAEAHLAAYEAVDAGFDLEMGLKDSVVFSGEKSVCINERAFEARLPPPVGA